MMSNNGLLIPLPALWLEYMVTGNAGDLTGVQYIDELVEGLQDEGYIFTGKTQGFPFEYTLPTPIAVTTAVCLHYIFEETNNH